MNSPEKSLFSDEKWEQIVSLVDDLNLNQAKWLQDYLARLNGTSLEVSANRTIKSAVAFASETGNSKAIAQELVQKALSKGKQLELIDLATAKLRHLKNLEQLFIVCSTHGDGDPPEPAESFFKILLSSDTPLQQLSYAVLALGDSTYEKFCESGKQLDQKLSELSAIRLIDRVDCDVDYEDQADAWMEEVLGFVNATIDNVSEIQTDNALTKQVEITRSNPCESEVLENICLSNTERPNTIHHLELSLEQAASLELSPGDSVGVCPSNPPELVKRVLTLMGYSGDESVSVKGLGLPLVQALRERFDLVVVSTKFLKKWAELSGSATLKSVVSGKQKQIRDFLRQHRLTDILAEFNTELSAQTFIDLLRPLQPRLYDVANSLRHTPDELHLTVERYNYQLFGRQFSGIASNFLADLDEGESISIFPQINKKFHLPKNTTVPIIMIADGTGIAPFRSFIQEIAANEERQNPTWLIFREQFFLEDFLYQIEWQKNLEEGHLTKLNAVFFGDDPSRTTFDVVTDNYELFKGWLEAGAHLYLAGHKHQHEAFLSLLASGLKSDPSISRTWAAMPNQGRIHRNLY